jgi:hypothetical protein
MFMEDYHFSALGSFKMETADSTQARPESLQLVQNNVRCVL